MANRNGLLAPTATHGALAPSYYLLRNEALVEPTLVAPIALESFDREATAQIAVRGFTGGAPVAYTGGITLNPGASSLGTAPAGLNVHSIANGCAVEVGTDSATANTLSIAGPSGLGLVYDEVYNQPVSLQPITQVQTAPLLTPANPEEVLRATQAAVAAAIATPGSQFNIFRVPRSGAYMVQTEIAIGNATAVNTVVIPSTLVGGVPIWKSISLGFQVQGTVQAVPYASFEVIGGDFYGDQAFSANSLITKTFTSVAILQAGVNYAITLNCEAGWNIGDGGQIKTELVAMC